MPIFKATVFRLGTAPWKIKGLAHSSTRNHCGIHYPLFCVQFSSDEFQDEKHSELREGSSIGPEFGPKHYI